MLRRYIGKNGKTIEVDDRVIKCEKHRGARFGGAAMTFSKCKICGIQIVNESTTIDTVCIDCALEKGICIVCGKKIVN